MVWNTASNAYQTIEGTDLGTTYTDGKILTAASGPHRSILEVSNTGFYLRKYIDPGVNTSTRGILSDIWWVRFRLGEIYLNASEAAFELGQTADALLYINAIRERAGFPANSVKSLTIDRIQNERRVELCFEDHRFFDVRRWKLGEQLFNKPVRGVVITSSNGSATGTMTYNYVNVQNRVFDAKMYRFPFPQTEINKTTKLVQNPGW